MKPCKRGHTSGRYKDGHCKECHALAVVRWQKKNRKKVAAIQAKYNSTNSEKVTKRTLAGKVRDPSKVKAQRKRSYVKRASVEIRKPRERRLRNPERHRQLQLKPARKLRNADPDRFRLKVRARRAKLANGNVSSDIIRRLLVSQLGLCVYCKADLVSDGMKYEIDHIMPIALGGLHEDSNLQLLCRSCNRRKHAKHPDVFAAEIGWAD
jgi:5-methylcytosine-specific restriction endonuclease McrA